MTANQPPMARAIRCCAVFVLPLLAFSATLAAQDPVTSGSSVQLRGVAEPGRIRGTVFDSLVMRAVPGALVTLLGIPKPAIADGQGRFSFDNVPIGERTVQFAAPEIDSLGFGALGATVTVRSREETNVSISTPSLRTLWNRLCGESTPLSADSGIVWGAIRSAESGQMRAGAYAGFRWYDLDPNVRRGLSIRDTRKEIATNRDGLFFACGVPTGVTVTSEGIDSSAASGLLEYSLGERRLLRLDLLVSRDMVVPDSSRIRTSADAPVSTDARGLASVHGTILDEKNRPLNNAIISVPSAGRSIRTNGRGQFMLAGLPAGTQSLQIRRLGYAMRTHIVALRPNETTDIAVQIAGMNVLSTYNVRANISKGSERLAFEARRAQGKGMFLEGRDLSSRRHMEDVLRTFPDVELRYNSTGGYRMVMYAGRGPLEAPVPGAANSGTSNHSCSPEVWVDDLHSSLSVVALYKPEDFRAVEAYTRVSEIPLKYLEYPIKSLPCAVLLFWSRSAKW